MPLRSLAATRYVTPLREGGSLPAIVEADDSGLYVLKFRGAGQGPNALVAELLAGEIARAAGLTIPELVVMDLDPDLARTEPDPEIQALIRASAGANLALDYLPGATMFDPVVDRPEGQIASAVVWLDAFVSNVDRTARNANMLMWHRRLWLIDHGAAFYFHHAGGDYSRRAHDPFPMIKDHVLLPLADALESVDAAMDVRLGGSVFRDIVDLVPAEWLEADPSFVSAGERRDAYVDYLAARMVGPRAFVEEAIRARSRHL
jgi:hypothetical protein